MLTTVLWRDASIATDEEGTPDTIKGTDDATQILESCGWFLGVKNGQVLIGQDLAPRHPDQLVRSIVRIPAPLVIEIRRWVRGPRVSLTERAALGSTDLAKNPHGVGSRSYKSVSAKKRR